MEAHESVTNIDLLGKALVGEVINDLGAVGEDCRLLALAVTGDVKDKGRRRNRFEVRAVVMNESTGMNRLPWDGGLR